MTSIPAELLQPNTEMWNAAWLDSEGNFHVTKYHSTFQSDKEYGYGHYSIGWVRVYYSSRNSEIGFDAGTSNRKPNADQQAALIMLARVAEPKTVVTNGGLFQVANKQEAMKVVRELTGETTSNMSPA